MFTMNGSNRPLELRKRPRAQLSMPVRIRWRGPFGMRLEIAQTLDVSRGGLLIERLEPCEPQSNVWVLFPFEPNGDSAQVETPAHVVRVEEAYGGRYRIALKLDLPARGDQRLAAVERRSFPRLPFAVPIFVRPSSSPWPEESMTQDISRAGVRFTSARIFAVGDAIKAKVPFGEWSRTGEIAGIVTRIESYGDSSGSEHSADLQPGTTTPLTSVAAAWIRPLRI